jgi:hypothetical protein
MRQIVDGGHRAIKYTRIGGVGGEIYSEGMRSLSFRLYLDGIANEQHQKRPSHAN